ncbi:MAG: T9SS type A sorting domain-containing protein, partial [Bacteroidota bacterium]|nr:T9SS type A sorting domain-containing protein [Bacteroidota bacterium]
TESLITNLAPGTYTVTVTDINFCTATASATVGVGGCGTLSAEITPESCFEVCDAGIVVSFNNGIQPITYLWSTGHSTASIGDLCDGTFIVTATDANGCEVVETYMITGASEILVNIGSTNESETGAGDGTAWAEPTGGQPPYSYNWNNGVTDSLLTNLVPGLYTVTVTDANGCSAVDEVQVNNTTGYSPVSVNRIKIYPNPASDKLYVHHEFIADTEIRLFSVEGIELKHSISGSVLELGDIPSGLYLVKVVAGKDFLAQIILILK